MTSCVLCGSSTDKNLHLGRMVTLNKVSVHINCLYLSSNLVQRGDESKSICNFALKDILAEAERCRNLLCFYCRKRGANIGCCKSGCRRKFHSQCGIDNLAQNMYFGTYQSFCHSHIMKFSKRPSNSEMCIICYDDLRGPNDIFNCTKYLHGFCCNNGWYHKNCLQGYANSAGYFFKCPLCNDSKVFSSSMLWGICVPESDASWEEGDAYADQLELATQCTAVHCKCETGREASVSNLCYCILCGSNPMHPLCTEFAHNSYRCNDCVVVSDGETSSSEEDDTEDDIFESIAEGNDGLVLNNTASAQRPITRQTANLPDATVNIAEELRPIAAQGISGTQSSATRAEGVSNNAPPRVHRAVQMPYNQPSRVLTSHAPVGVETRSARSIRLSARLARNDDSSTSNRRTRSRSARRMSALQGELNNNEPNDKPEEARARVSGASTSHSRPSNGRVTAQQPISALQGELNNNASNVIPVPMEIDEMEDLEPVASTSQNCPSRRRTVAAQNRLSLMDVSCVASRTRARSRK